MMAASIMSDCQEMFFDNGGSYDFMVVEDVRQALNRAKWILFEYVDKTKSVQDSFLDVNELCGKWYIQLLTIN